MSVTRMCPGGGYAAGRGSGGRGHCRCGGLRRRKRPRRTRCGRDGSPHAGPRSGRALRPRDVPPPAQLVRPRTCRRRTRRRHDDEVHHAVAAFSGRSVSDDDRRRIGVDAVGDPRAPLRALKMQPAPRGLGRLGPSADGARRAASVAHRRRVNPAIRVLDAAPVAVRAFSAGENISLRVTPTRRRTSVR